MVRSPDMSSEHIGIPAMGSIACAASIDIAQIGAPSWISTASTAAHSALCKGWEIIFGGALRAPQSGSRPEQIIFAPPLEMKV